MAESETPKDTAYSDEEFGSEHEYESDDDDFVDEKAVDEAEEIVKLENPVEVDEETKGQYDAEFDKDDRVEVSTGSPTLEPAKGDAMVKDLPEDGEAYDGEFEAEDRLQDDGAYDGEFDEEDRVADNYDTTMEQTPTAADVLTTVPQDDKEVEKVLLDNDTGMDQTDANEDGEAEYSNDEEHDSPVAPPVITFLFPGDSSGDDTAQQRSSIPSSEMTQLSEDSPPIAQSVRAGSMPMALSATPPDKWMAIIPQELSPEKHDRSRRQTECFPVQEETQQQDLIENEKDTDADNSSSVPNNGSSGSLPRVEEIHAAEDTTATYDNFNSDDEGSYGEDSHSSFASDNDNDEVNPATAERPESGSTSAVNSISGAEHDSKTAENESATTLAGDIALNTPTTIALTEAEQNSLKECNESNAEPLQSNNDDDDYADEMDDEFPSDSNTPQYDIPNKSGGDEANEYDVDEFESGRRETETLLHEARELLKLQNNDDTSMQADNNTDTIPVQNGTCEEKSKESRDEKNASPYDNDDEFSDADAEIPTDETPEQHLLGDHGEIAQYELDADDFEGQEVAVKEEPNVASEVVNVELATHSAVHIPQHVEVTNDTQHVSADSSGSKMEQEGPTGALSGETLPHTLGEVITQSYPAQPPDISQPTEPPSPAVAIEQKKSPAKSSSKVSLKSSRPDNERVASRHTRPKQPVKLVEPQLKQQITPKQPSPPMKPCLQTTKRATPASPSAPSTSSIDKSTTTPRSSRSKLKTATSDYQAQTLNPTPSANSATKSTFRHQTSSNTSLHVHVEKQGSPSKTRQKASSPRSPLKACSGPYLDLPNEYPRFSRKEPVPRQQVSSKPSTSGEHGGKRRLLQPVRTPANLRFDLPKMDKTKRDWLFVNMFRHGDDLSKFEAFQAFVPPTLLARPPTAKETKKRPLSARQVYGNPHSSRFVNSGRKLIPQPNPELQDRERNWVGTTPHDSTLPAYDSILDKYCTTVTSPLVQRQIYQTRYRDLSPQLAFVLEKRVEKHCRNGFYDSFGGVSSSYKTEIVPTSPGDSTRQRQMPSRSSRIVERQATNPVAPLEE